MTLARGSIRGYDDDRMVLLFSMMDGTREVLCAVSGSAMDDLEHVPRTPADQREEQFTRLRDRIEACASRKFLAREFEGNPPCLRQIEARQLIRIRREVELLGIAVGRHIGVQRRAVGLLGDPLDRRRIGLVAHLRVDWTIRPRPAISARRDRGA